MPFNDEYVSIKESQFEILYGHCLDCPHFASQRQVLDGEFVAHPIEHPAAANHRCTNSSQLLAVPQLRNLVTLQIGRRSLRWPRWQEVRNSFLQKVPKPTTWRVKQT